MGYLNNITSLNDLTYVFNASKLTPQQARTKMQTVFRNNATAIFNTKPSLFNTIEISTNNFIDTPAKLEAFAKNSTLDADFKAKVLHFVITN